MTDKQLNFLKNEIWLLTFGGAFQRNSVYNDKATEKRRAHFRKNIRNYIENVILPNYNNKIDDAKHRAMIFAITENSEIYNDILVNGRLSIGSAQKLLNLVLKYYWCLGWLPEPPHFPVDSQIQKCLPFKNRKRWTAINSLQDYQAIIECAKGLLENGESLAQWELRNFKWS